MTGNTEFLSIREAAALLGLTIVETDELLRRNEIESRTLVLRSSLDDYRAVTA